MLIPNFVPAVLMPLVAARGVLSSKFSQSRETVTTIFIFSVISILIFQNQT